MYRTLLLCLVVAACNDLPPADFTADDGKSYTMPPERNVPKETAARPGVEVHAYTVPWSGLPAGCNHGDGLKLVGCTLLLVPTDCMVWIVGPIPAALDARVRRHEIGGHCNGYTHTIVAGPVLEWRK